MEQLPTSFLWLIAGAFFMGLEAFGVSGIGFLFAGLAAITTGIIIESAAVGTEAYVAQFAWFFGCTALWGALLWKPLRKFQKGRKASDGYHNMIGDVAIVSESGIKKGEAGQAHWSGTIMRAQLSSHCATEALPTGSKVKIVDVKGATLIVEPL